MNSFTPPETKALELLLAQMIGCKALEELLQSNAPVKIEELADGYDLVVEHPNLPAEAIVIGSPKVIGQLANIRVRYAIKIESHRLRLLCRVSSGDALPASFRQSPVSISVG